MYMEQKWYKNGEFKHYLKFTNETNNAYGITYLQNIKTSYIIYIYIYI